VFNQFGDLERCALRSGNVHSADGWEGVLKPVVVRYKGRKVRLYFRGNAAFASPEMYDYLEAEGFLHAIRLPKNRILQDSIGHLLTRPVGRPPICAFQMVEMPSDSKVESASTASCLFRMRLSVPSNSSTLLSVAA